MIDFQKSATKLQQIFQINKIFSKKISLSSLKRDFTCYQRATVSLKIFSANSVIIAVQSSSWTSVRSMFES